MHLSKISLGKALSLFWISKFFFLKAQNFGLSGFLPIIFQKADAEPAFWPIRLLLGFFARRVGLGLPFKAVFTRSSLEVERALK